MGVDYFSWVIIGVKIKLEDLYEPLQLTVYCDCKENDKTKSFCSECGHSNNSTQYVFLPINGLCLNGKKLTNPQLSPNVKDGSYSIGPYSIVSPCESDDIFICIHYSMTDSSQEHICENFTELSNARDCMEKMLKPMNLWKNFGIYNILECSY
jgi:hypothetical protein